MFGNFILRFDPNTKIRKGEIISVLNRKKISNVEIERIFESNLTILRQFFWVRIQYQSHAKHQLEKIKAILESMNGIVSITFKPEAEL